MSVGHVLSSARSVVWTVGWHESANSVQAIAVLRATKMFDKLSIHDLDHNTHPEVSCPARRNVGTSRSQDQRIESKFQAETEEGTYATGFPRRSCACFLEYHWLCST